jgi:hypothetical protein
MRLNEDEPASVVLARLRANEPRLPQPPAEDPTFSQRYMAWRQAIAREEARERGEETELREMADEQERQRKQAVRDLRAQQEKLGGVTTTTSSVDPVERPSPSPTPEGPPESATAAGGKDATRARRSRGTAGGRKGEGKKK